MTNVLLAALDLGTNSFHMVVARAGNEGQFEIVTRERALVRLGRGGGDMKFLSDDAIDRGIAAMRRMRMIAEGAGARIRAVATSAVREAENAATFIDRARVEAQVEVEVISGLEEARLIHLGVLQAVPVYDRRLLLCDIGGGSTEVLVGLGPEVLAARSFKLGAIRLTDRFFRGGLVTGPAFDECRAYIRSLLAPFQREVADLGPEVGAGSSGTFEALVRVSRALRGESRLRTLNRQPLDRADLEGVIKAVTSAPTPDERSKVPGLEPDRADIIVAGALILEGVYDTFGVESMMFSEYALREGVLLDTLSRLDGSMLHHLRDVTRRSVRHLAEQCDPDPVHSRHVAGLALQLFDATRPIHGLDDGCREYLEAAALLANVGLMISHDRHHHHSYYLIRNAEHLIGFTDHEIEIIALVARYHRKSAPKPSHAEFARLSPADQHVVNSLAGLLRIAIGLDRSHDGRVVGLTAELADDHVTVTLRARTGGSGPEDLALERYSALDRRQLFEAVTGRRLVLAP